MRDEYKKELTALKVKMDKAEKFAEKLPFFAKYILDYKLTGEEEYTKFGDKYKDIYLGWGINRGFYKKGSSRYLMNCRGDYDHGYFFSIYINSYALFDEHNNYGLYDALKDVDIFHADNSNTNFYITDENIESFLDALNIWYLAAREENTKFRAQKKIDKARHDLEKAEKQLQGATQ